MPCVRGYARHSTQPPIKFIINPSCDFHFYLLSHSTPPTHPYFISSILYTLLNLKRISISPTQPSIHNPLWSIHSPKPTSYPIPHLSPFTRLFRYTFIYQNDSIPRICIEHSLITRTFLTYLINLFHNLFSHYSTLLNLLLICVYLLKPTHHLI